jgi:hypothetical protein
VVSLIILEFIVCISKHLSIKYWYIHWDLVSGLFYYQPYYSRGYNRVNYLLAGTKLVTNVLLLVFVDKLHVHVCLYLEFRCPYSHCISANCDHSHWFCAFSH